MKSFFSTKLYLHPLATPWTMRIESLRKSSAVESPGGDFGVKTLETLVLSQRLRLKTLAFQTWFFDQVVHASGMGPENGLVGHSLRGQRLWCPCAVFGDSGPERLETLG
jgi:hypothetical protein